MRPAFSARPSSAGITGRVVLPRQGRGKQLPAAGGGLFDKEKNRARIGGQSGHQLRRCRNVACKARHGNDQGWLDIQRRS